MDGDKIELIKQALNAAESSISLAKRLLGDSDGGRNAGPSNYPRRDRNDDRFRDRGMPSRNMAPEQRSADGSVMGIFDGRDMVTAGGKHYPLGANQIIKSLMVAGDQLKMTSENGTDVYKQIQRVKRKRLTGILVKKEGKWSVLTEEGSYHILDEDVSEKNLAVENRVDVLTSGTQKTQWAIIEKGSTSEPEEQTDKNLSEETTSTESQFNIITPPIEHKKQQDDIAETEQKKTEKKEKEDKTKERKPALRAEEPVIELVKPVLQTPEDLKDVEELR